MNSLKISSGDISFLQATYKHQSCVQLPVCLVPEVLTLLTSSFKQNFEKRTILLDSTEYTLSNALLKLNLDVIFNSPQFLAIMSEISGQTIRFTRQRLYYLDSDCIS